MSCVDCGANQYMKRLFWNVDGEQVCEACHQRKIADEDRYTYALKVEILELRAEVLELRAEIERFKEVAETQNE